MPATMGQKGAQGATHVQGGVVRVLHENPHNLHFPCCRRHAHYHRAMRSIPAAAGDLAMVLTLNLDFDLRRMLTWTMTLEWALRLAQMCTRSE